MNENSEHIATRKRNQDIQLHEREIRTYNYMKENSEHTAV